MKDKVRRRTFRRLVGPPPAQFPAFKPLALNPEPFSGNQDQDLICEKCGGAYTMREFRIFAWVEFSALCVACGAEAMREKIRQIIWEDKL